MLVTINTPNANGRWLKLKKVLRVNLKGGSNLPISKIITLIVDIFSPDFGCSAAGNVYNIAEPLFDWALPNLYGNRYQKLLTRALVADNEYKVLQDRIKQVWQNQ